MKLNQVSLPATDLARAVAFYRRLGYGLIVLNDHYARLENPFDLSTLSLVLAPAVGEGAHIYLECDDLDARVEALKTCGVTFDSGPQDQSWLWREAWLQDSEGNRLCLYFAGDNRRFPPWRIGDSARADDLNA